jgi:hypothetical protein
MGRGIGRWVIHKIEGREESGEMRTRPKRSGYTSVMPSEEAFWRGDAETRERLARQARQRPNVWRYALMFTRTHEPECFAVGPNGFGRDVQFRVSTEPNVAGFFVGWRSVEEKDGARSLFDYVADKEREGCRQKTLERALRYAQKRGNADAIARVKKSMKLRGSA